MTDASGGPRYIEATWKGRLKFAVAYLAFASWFMSHLVWVPRVITPFDECNPCANLGTIQFLIGYAMLVPLLAALLLGWHAWVIHRTGQIPVPDAWVLYRQRVWTGAWAQFTAGFVAIGALLWATLPIVIWREIDGAAIFINHGC